MIDLIFDFSSTELRNIKLSARIKIFFWFPYFLFFIVDFSIFIPYTT